MASLTSPYANPMRPPPLFLPPSGDSNAAKPSHHQDANAPLLNHDALAQTGADSGSCGSSRDGDWDDTDEGTAQHDLFFQELRALPSVFASCALPLLLSSAAAVGETIIAAWLGPQALLAYAAATFIQAPITSIAGAMVDACGMLSTQAVGPVQQLLWFQVAVLWSPVVLSLCVAIQVAAAHALPLFPALVLASPVSNSSANITLQPQAAAATASPLDFALASAYLSPLQFFSEISCVMIIAARASSTPPLLLSVLLLPVHIVLAVVLSLGLLSFRGFGVFGLLYAIAATRLLFLVVSILISFCRAPVRPTSTPGCPALNFNRFALWMKRSAAVAATRLLLDAPQPLMFFLAVAKGGAAGQQAAVEASLLLLLLRVPDAFSAGLASAIALRVSDHLSAAHALRARAAAAAAAATALVLAAAAAAAAALALPPVVARFCFPVASLPASVIAAASAVAAAAAAAGSVEGLLYGQGRVAIINASGIFSHWVIALPVAVWLLHAQVLSPLACVCAASTVGHALRAALMTAISTCSSWDEQVKLAMQRSWGPPAAAATPPRYYLHPGGASGRRKAVASSRSSVNALPRGGEGGAGAVTAYDAHDISLQGDIAWDRSSSRASGHSSARHLHFGQ